MHIIYLLILVKERPGKAHEQELHAFASFILKRKMENEWEW